MTQKLNLNLTHLINFIKVVEWGSVSKAATQLNIAQPALSRQIQALEAEFDAPLLRRHKWGVEPTEDGSLVVEFAARIEKECLSLRDEIRSNRDDPSGSVYLGIPSAYSVTLAPALIQRMRETRPNITVHIVEGFSRAVFEWLINGRLDVAMLYQSKELRVENTLPFLTEELVALVSTDAFPGENSIPMADLADGQSIITRPPHFLRLAMDTKFQELGIPFQPKIEIDSLRCMIEMAQMGDGVAFMPRSCVLRDIESDRLRGLSLNPRMELTTVLGQTPSRKATRATMIVIDMLRELAVDLAPSTGWQVDSVD